MELAACYMANAFKFNTETKQITLAKMKNPLKVKLSRPFNGTTSSVYVSKTKTGKYFISMLVETEIQPLPIASKTVGVDVGIKSLAACSDGVVFNNLKYTKKYEKKLAKAISDAKLIIQFDCISPYYQHQIKLRIFKVSFDL